MPTLLARSPITPAVTRREGVRVRPVPRVIGADVPVPVRDGGQVPYANLDYAASAPCLEAVHEAGSPNVLGVVALAAACETLSGSWEALAAHEETLVNRLRSGLAALPSVRELTLWGERAPRVGIVSFVVDGWNARDVALTLSEEYGIGVRDGKFCAHPFVRHLLGGAGAGCSAGRGTAVRASLGIGTSEEHIGRLRTALAELTAR